MSLSRFLREKTGSMATIGVATNHKYQKVVLE